VVRNRIYNEVFNQDWVTKVKPVAEVEMPDGKRIRIKHAATIGRTESNDIALPNPRVSRRHAVIQSQSSNELWLVDLGSRNGIFINGKRVTQPSLLRDRDLISIGPFQLTFIQPNAPRLDGGSQTTMDRTVID
jgi:pSer/pThr/pTyr-binding forkhead associated (FHA) protein